MFSWPLTMFFNLKNLINFFLHYLLCVCVCTCHGAHVEVREQVLGVSFLSPCGFQELISGGLGIECFYSLGHLASQALHLMKNIHSLHPL